jgi:hypothetical protein
MAGALERLHRYPNTVSHGLFSPSQFRLMSWNQWRHFCNTSSWDTLASGEGHLITVSYRKKKVGLFREPTAVSPREPAFCLAQFLEGI